MVDTRSSSRASEVSMDPQEGTSQGTSQGTPQNITTGNQNETILMADEENVNKNEPPIYNGLGLLSKLPTFGGGKRRIEKTKEQELQIFLRAMDSYIAQCNITSDERKKDLLINQINREEGGAISFVGVINNRSTYEECKRDLREMYGISEGVLFQKMAGEIQQILKKGMRLDDTTICKLGENAINMIESFINGPNMRDFNVSPEQKISTKNGRCFRIIDLISAIFMHFFIAPWLSEVQYKTIAEVTPDNHMQRMTANIINTVRGMNGSETFKIEEDNNNETLYTIDTKTLKCTFCGKIGHTEENCRMKLFCGRCSRRGHLTKDCRSKNGYKNNKRQKNKKYCQDCKREGHLKEECFRNHTCKICSKTGHLEKHCWQNKNKNQRQYSKDRNNKNRRNTRNGENVLNLYENEENNDESSSD